ncbi:hypothetical protein JL721_513 [Aureococcus anophagefferens]|nr:hypothetical protein JL721_513 [Aureococcus anophagefferens]
MGASSSQPTAPVAAAPLPKKRVVSPDAFVRVLKSNESFSAVLSFTGFESVLTIETLSHAARRASRAAELELDMTKIYEAPQFKSMGVRRATFVANRAELLGARRSGLLPPIVSTMTVYRGYYWPLAPSTPWTKGDFVYPAEGGARLLALLAHGYLTVYVDPIQSDPRAHKVARRYFETLRQANGKVGARKRRAGADEAAALIEAMGGACLPRLLRDAAERFPGHDHDGRSAPPELYRDMLERSAASASSVDAALLRRVVDAVVWAGLQRSCMCPYGHRLTERDFEAACRDAAVPRWREIWAEAVDGLLLPFCPGYQSEAGDVESHREPGDVRPGDVAVVEVSGFALLAALSGAVTSRCGGDPAACFGADLEPHVTKYHGANLSLAIGVLKDLEARRDGEADGSAGERRLEAALEAVLARHVPWKEGDDVEIYDTSVANTDPREGVWKSGKLGLPTAEYGYYKVRRGDDEADTAAHVAHLRKLGEPSAATELLIDSVIHSRNDVVRRMLDLSPDFAREAAFCPGHLGKGRQTALDHAITSGNSVALRLLLVKAPFDRTGSAYLLDPSSAFTSIRNQDYNSCKLAPKIRAELLCILYDSSADDWELDLADAAVAAAVSGDADRAWLEIGNLVAAQKRAELFHSIRSFTKKHWPKKKSDATVGEDDSSDDEDEALCLAREAVRSSATNALCAAARRPLEEAAHHGQPAAIAVLLKDPQVRDSLRERQSNAIVLAAARGHVSSLKLLLDVDGVDASRVRPWPSEDSHTSPLIFAVSNERPEAVKVLIRYGADVNYCHPKYKTPLGIASIQGFDDIVAILLDAGATVLRNDGNLSALSLACRNFYATWKGYDNYGDVVLKLLLDERPDECPVDVPAAPMCECVACHGTVAMVKVFLDDAGVDVNQSIQDSGVTALHLAVYSCVRTEPELLSNERAAAVIRFLVERGADLEARTRCQPTPRSIYAPFYTDMPVGATPRDIAAVCGTPERQDAVAALLAAAVAERALKPA